ncbi:MAG: PVC-type heme-binding CxxCH protein, partial [Pirellulales bacterium]
DGKLYFTQGDARYGTDHIEEEEVTFDVVDQSGRRVQSARYGTTSRVNLDGTMFEVLGYRQRNNYETCVDSFGNVFVSDNDDDGDRGCRMVWMMDGGDYGYRTPGSSRQFAEEVPGVVPKLVGTGNGSPAGILVYEADLFPKEYHGAVLQVDAGTHQVNFHPLQRRGAAFRSEYRVLLRSEDSWSRPVDAAVAPDGSLYVCDWYDAGVGGNRLSDQDTGRIFWVKPAGSQPQAERPDFARPAGQIAALTSPNVATWFAARQLLVAQGSEARKPLLTLYQSGRPHQRARALFVLAELPETGRRDVLAGLHDADPRIRELSLRILTSDLRRESVVEPESAKTVEPRAVELLGDIFPLTDDPDAGVRRALILALRHVDTQKAGDALAKLSNGWDGVDRYYLEALSLALRDREPEFIDRLFAAAAGQALAVGWNDEPVALPPYFPVTTNDAFLQIGDELPPANAASKVIGLAWVLGRSEALPALRAILEKNESPEITRGADAALDRFADPRAAELLIDRFLAVDDPQRQREILQRLGFKLAGPWSPMRESRKMQRVLDVALSLGDLRAEAIKTIARGRIDAYRAQLLALADDQRQELSTRAAALEALGKLRYEPVRALAARFVEQAKGQPRGGALAQAALSAVSDLRGAQGQETLVSVFGDPQYPLDFRRRAIQTFAATTEGARRLLAIHQKKGLPEDLGTEVVYLLHNHPDRVIRRLARAEIPLPETSGGKRIGDLEEILALRGDVRRGREFFHGEGSDACQVCHRVEGVGNWVGPDLSSIGTKYGKSELLYHILNPSGAINYNYVSYTLILVDGRILTGLIADQTADQLVLKTAQGDRIEIPADDIDERIAQNISIMPENMVATMTEQDLADLIAYMATLRQAVSSVGEYYVLGPLAEDTYDGSIRPDLRATWPGAGGRKTRWRRVLTGRDGHLDLSSLLGSEEGKEVYCYVPVTSGRRQDARIVLNCPSATALWHNGGAVPLGDPQVDGLNTLWKGEMELKAGANSLVIRLRSGQIKCGLTATLVTDRTVRFDFGSK